MLGLEGGRECGGWDEMRGRIFRGKDLLVGGRAAGRGARWHSRGDGGVAGKAGVRLCCVWDANEMGDVRRACCLLPAP